MIKTINAWLINQEKETTTANYVELDGEEYLDNEVLVEVKNSAINYKDALALTGTAPIIRNFPLIPGIDFSGVVVNSKGKHLKEGDKVFATGWGLGELYHGGLASHCAFEEKKLIKIPEHYTYESVMGLGTAGLTACLAVNSIIENNITPQDGKILVTGPSGAVGGIAVKLLLKHGFEVSVVTSRKIENESYLEKFGSIEILEAQDFMNKPKMLSKELWAGAVDVVGGNILENIITQTNRAGVVSICGQVLGLNLNTNVAPFILRGVKLIGIDSSLCPEQKRRDVWDKLFDLIDMRDILQITEKINITDAVNRAELMISGRSSKRIIIEN